MVTPFPVGNSFIISEKLIIFPPASKIFEAAELEIEKEHTVIL